LQSNNYEHPIESEMFFPLLQYSITPDGYTQRRLQSRIIVFLIL